MNEPLLTVKDVSSFLGLHPNTIYKLVKKGEIFPVRMKGIGIKFNQAEIEKRLNQGLNYPSQISPVLPKPKPLDISLEKYDKLFLKGDSAVSKKRQRWSYGGKGVFKRKLKRGYSWCYWYYDKKGEIKKVTVPGATCKEDAITAMDEKVEEVKRKHGAHKVSITFREFAPIYMEKYAIPNKRSHYTDQKFLDAQLVPFFGDIELSKITPEHVSDFVAKRKQDAVKGSTINKHLQVLNRMMNIAEEFGYEVDKNPVRRKIHFSKESKYRRTRVLSHEEEQRLMNESATHLKPIIQCALLQGMRLQEILQLKVTDVDFEADTITIRPEVNKTGKLDIIPIRNELKSILKNLIADNVGRTLYVFNYLDPRTGEYRPIKSIQHAFQAACRRAGIEDFQFRDLRRSTSTRLHEAGVDLLVISRLLRHSSTKISTEVYIQSSLKMLKEALKKVDKAGVRKVSLLSYLEHNWNTEELDKKKTPTISLFSMN